MSGPDLESIEQGGKIVEAALKKVPSVLSSTVFYDRAVGAPYIEIKLNRQHMARYGITVADLQDVIGAAVGGMPLTTTVEGRERFPVRLRYPRELRENPDELARLIVPTATAPAVPVGAPTEAPEEASAEAPEEAAPAEAPEEAPAEEAPEAPAETVSE